MNGNYEAVRSLPEGYDELWVLGDLVNYCIGFADFVVCQRPPSAHLLGEHSPRHCLRRLNAHDLPQRCSDQCLWTSSALSLSLLLGRFPLGHYLKRSQRFIPESLQPPPQRLNAPSIDRVDPSSRTGTHCRSTIGQAAFRLER